MKFNDYLKSAQTNLGRSKLRTFLTVFAIVIGTFTLAMTTAFGQGLQRIINSQLQAYSSPNMVNVTLASNDETATPGTMPVYHPGRQTGPNRQQLATQHDINVIRSLPNVSAVYPYHNVNADYVQYRTGKYLISLGATYPGDQITAASGSLPAQGSNGIILPFPYIKTFGASRASDLIGKNVVVHLASQAHPGVQEDVIFKITGFLADTTHIPSALVDQNELSSLANFQSDNNPTYTNMAVITRGPLSLAQNKALKAALSAKGYSGETYADVRDNFKQPLQIVQYGLDGFAGVALLAAAIGIINTLLMAVLERTQEIGLMKALGMRSRGVFALFITEAMTIGLWGGAIGVILAVSAGSLANKILLHVVFKDSTATKLLVYPLAYMAAIILGAMILGIIAGTLPALRASRLDPIEALRKE